MKCSNCGKELTEDAKYCNNCGTSILVNNSQVNEQINVEQMQRVEQKTTNKRNNIVIILVVVIIIIGGIIGGVFFINNFMKNTKLEDKTGENDVKHKEGRIKILEEDGDYKKYLLSLGNFEANNKYDFKLNNNHVITLDIMSDDIRNITWNILVDGKNIFEDWTSLGSDEPLELETYTLGDYVILKNIGFTYIKAQVVYVIDKDGNLVKEIFNVGENEALVSNGIDSDPEKYGVDATGITISADRLGGSYEYACGKKEENFTDCDVNLCDRLSWPEGFDENTIYGATIKYEYKNGVLDLEEKILESETVGEFINKHHIEEYYCKEQNN